MHSLGDTMEAPALAWTFKETGSALQRCKKNGGALGVSFVHNPGAVNDNQKPFFVCAHRKGSLGNTVSQ